MYFPVSALTHSTRSENSVARDFLLDFRRLYGMGPPVKQDSTHSRRLAAFPFRSPFDSLKTLNGFTMPTILSPSKDRGLRERCWRWSRKEPSEAPRIGLVLGHLVTRLHFPPPVPPSSRAHVSPEQVGFGWIFLDYPGSAGIDPPPIKARVPLRNRPSNLVLCNNYIICAICVIRVICGSNPPPIHPFTHSA